MGEVRIREEIGAPAERVWQIVADFGGVDRWIPGVEKVDVQGEGIGAVRSIPMGGATIVERLESCDAQARRLQYSVVEGPMPVEKYLATIAVSELGPDRCRIDWSVDFEPVGVAAEQLAPGIEGAYRGAIQGLAKLASG